MANDSGVPEHGKHAAASPAAQVCLPPCRPAAHQGQSCRSSSVGSMPENLGAEPTSTSAMITAGGRGGMGLWLLQARAVFGAIGGNHARVEGRPDKALARAGLPHTATSAVEHPPAAAHRSNLS